MPPEPGYDEQLRVPLRWWAVGTMFWASTLLAFLVAMPAAVALLVIGTLSAINAGLFLGYGSARIQIAQGELRAGRAVIGVHLLADPQPLDEAGSRAVAGVDADARAFLLLRPYLRAAVRVRVTDPGDPTPYWLLSTRHPGPLAEELAGAIARAGQREAS